MRSRKKETIGTAIGSKIMGAKSGQKSKGEKKVMAGSKEDSEKRGTQRNPKKGKEHRRTGGEEGWWNEKKQQRQKKKPAMEKSRGSKRGRGTK